MCTTLGLHVYNFRFACVKCRFACVQLQVCMCKNVGVHVYNFRFACVQL